MVSDGWKISTLGEISKISSGGTPSRSNRAYWGGNIAWVTTAEVRFNTIFDTEEKITELGLEESSAKVYPINTILMAMYGQGKTRGQVAMLGIEATTNQACAAIGLNENYDPNYYFQFLLSRYKHIRNLSNNGGQQNLSAEIVKSIQIPIPPLLEQKKISQILSTWNKAITTAEKLLENSRIQKQALMQQMLTGKKRLLDKTGLKFTSNWEEVDLGVLFSFKRGKGLSKGEITATGKNKCILYGQLYTYYSEVVDTVLSRTDSSEGELSKSGDILIPSSTTTSGIDLANATAILEDGVLLGGDINILRPKKAISSEFMAHLLTHIKKHEIASRAQGITIIHLYGSDLRNIKVKVPESIEEQYKIANVLHSADKEILTLESKLNLLKNEQKALMQQLLTGKRRVKVEV